MCKCRHVKVRLRKSSVRNDRDWNTFTEDVEKHFDTFFLDGLGIHHVQKKGGTLVLVMISADIDRFSKFLDRFPRKFTMQH